MKRGVQSDYHCLQGFIQSADKEGWQCQKHDHIKGLIAFL